MVVLLVQLFLNSLLSLLSLVDFVPVLLQRAPLVDVAAHSRRVVALLIVEQFLDVLALLLQWLLDSVSHLQRVHDRVASSLHK